MTTTDTDTPPRVGAAFLAVAAVGTLPYVELLATNRDESFPTSLVGWWLLTIAVLLSAVALARRIAGRGGARRTATFLVPLTWLFFHRPAVATLLEGVGLQGEEDLLVWGVGAALVAIPMVVLSRHHVVQIYAVLLAALLLVPPLLQFVLQPAPGFVDEPGAVTADPHPPLRDTPDVYYLLPDGYARADVVEKEGGVDITPFLDELEERGFRVQDRAVANYPTTFASVPSTLSMVYVIDDASPVGSLDQYYAAIRGDNPVVERFRAAGYLYVHAYTWDTAECVGHEDICIGDTGPIDEATAALLHATPIQSLVEELTDPLAHLRLYSDPVTIVREIAETPRTQPAFVFAHLLAPHPPFAWHADCSPRDTEWNITFWYAEEREAFGDTVECLNARLLRAIDLIVENDPTAVIVVQGDHGVAFDLQWERMGPADVGQRLPVLSALRLPPSCPHTPPDDLTPVNTFRIVFACLDGTDPVLLEDRHYWGQFGYERFLAIEDYLVAPLKRRGDSS